MYRGSNQLCLLLVANHEIVRGALRVLLERTGAIHVVEEAGTASSAWEQVTRFKLDLAKLDVRLPDRGGVDFCRGIRAAFPHTHVLFLTALPDTDTLRASVVGGGGWLSSQDDRSRDSLVEAIQAVASGKGYLDHVAAGSVMSWLRASSFPRIPARAFNWLRRSGGIVLVAEGEANKEIGEASALSG